MAKTSMISSTYLAQDELSPIGVAELARVVHEHRCFSQAWRKEKAEASALALRKQLAEWADIPVWIKKQSTAVGKRITIFFSEGEKTCSEKRFDSPCRKGAAYTLLSCHNQQSDAHFERITLGSLIDNQPGIDALYGRLDKKCIAPYTPEDVAHLDLSKAQTIWTWDNGEIYPAALLCAPMTDVLNGPTGEYPVCIPAAWGKLDSYWHGWLHLHKGFTLVVCKAEGRYGLIKLRQLGETSPRIVGEWFQSCSWAFLSGGNGCGSGLLEAASSIEPDNRGELVCDVIDAQDGHRINPPGVKALMGSTNYEGTIVVNEVGFGRFARVLGRLNEQGVFYQRQAGQEGELEVVEWGVDDLCWLEIGSLREGLNAVRSAENGLWGYVDHSGTSRITSQFGDVWAFHYGTAVVQQAGNSLWGLIDKTGQWVLRPEWVSLERWSKHIIVAEDAELRWGAINDQGKFIVEFRSVEEWMIHPEVVKRLEGYEIGDSWSEDTETGKRRTLVKAIAEISKIDFRKKARRALLDCSTSLVGLEGVFDADTSERDLIEAGVWGQEVRLLRNKINGILQPGKGEMGRIGCYYPVGLSAFDLSLEAPVNGLAIQPEAAIGIPWRDLELIGAQAAKPEAEKPSPPTLPWP
ncbi:MAG: hypothetical protein A2X81_15110 [Desulfobacterales bacterium GWB2_56_26]|nr:MAG: hypothetical protein A2X81_15110 [Desulfobacterales bacterium GWB2_56_26]